MTGRNYGLGGLRLMVQILISGRVAGDPVGAEDRLGVRLAHLDRGRAGVRHHLRRGRARLVHLPEPQRAYTDKVFAGLAAVIVIGLLVENIVFQSVERLTVCRWAMQR